MRDLDGLLRHLGCDKIFFFYRKILLCFKVTGPLLHKKECAIRILRARADCAAINITPASCASLFCSSTGNPEEFPVEEQKSPQESGA